MRLCGISGYRRLPPDEDTTASTSTGRDSDTGTTDDNSGIYDPTEEFE
jgi:hypothetical protein